MSSLLNKIYCIFTHHRQTLAVYGFYTGYEVLVKKAGADTWVDFFIPESDIYSLTRYYSILVLFFLLEIFPLVLKTGLTWPTLEFAGGLIVMENLGEK